MKVAICSVGTELTSGDATDTNAVWLSQRLNEIGAEVGWHATVPDDHEAIVDTLRWLSERNDAVIVGGGLGPTPDDITRAAAADVVGAQLERREELVEAIAERFASHGAEMSDSNLRQADVPRASEAYPPVGTAPGFRVEVPRPDGVPCPIYVLPGVPFELKEMAERHVLPDLMSRGGTTASLTRVVHVTGMGESRVAETLRPVLEAVEDRDDVTLAFLASSDEVRVKVTGRGEIPDQARAAGGPIVAEIVELLGSAVAGVDDERMEEAVARLLRLAGLTVASAESCTAGLVSSRLSVVPGATDYLRGGVTVYATDAKSSVLGVDEQLVEEHGPCSAPTAEAMAVRVRELFDADLGISVVCVAGPSPQSGQPVGTTMWALATADEVRSWTRLVPGDRSTVTERAASAVLEALRRHLLALVEAREEMGGAPVVEVHRTTAGTGGDEDGDAGRGAR